MPGAFGGMQGDTELVEAEERKTGMKATEGKGAYLAKNVLLFSIMGFVPKIFSLLLVPLYTSRLSQGEYGVYDLLSTTVLLLLPVLTADIQDALVRFSLEGKYQKKEVFSISLGVTGLGTVLAALGALGVHALGLFSIEGEYLLFFVLMFFANGLYNNVTFFCRGIDKVGVLTVGTVISTAVILLGNVLFLVGFDWGLRGYCVANLLGTMVGVLWCFIGGRQWQYITLKVNKGLVGEMLRFSTPMVFANVAWWVNNASDRYIMTFMSGVAASGLYAVAYKIPNMLSALQNIFAQAWSISAVRDFDREDGDGFMGKMYGMMHTAMVLACSGILLFNVPAAKILYAGEFFEAWQFVPPLLLSVVFDAMGMFLGGIFTAMKDTRTISLTAIVGAVVNTGCNFLFIYLWGGYGAALATMLGYGTVLLLRKMAMVRQVKLKVPWKRYACAYGLLLVQMCLGWWGMKLFFAQLGILCLLGMLHRREILEVLDFVRAAWKNRKKEA